MSSRRARDPRFTEEETNNLILKLQALLPDHSGSSSRRTPASKTLQDVCNCIKSLQQEVDDLSETLSRILASRGIHDFDPNVLARLLHQ